MSDAKAYMDGTSYEVFIKRAHQTYGRGSVAGADVSYMRNLINTENGADLSRLAGTFDKQFVKVAGFISKALDKYLKMKLNPQERELLTHLKSELIKSRSSADLMEIVEDGLNGTQRFKDY